MPVAQAASVTRTHASRVLASHGHACSAQRGLSLLESLIALVVLAIAVISLLATQLRTLADARTGVHRAQAVRLIEDLGERLKSNPEGFIQLGEFASDSPVSGTAGGSAFNCALNLCTPQQLAQWDLANWHDDVKRQLPGGQAQTFLSPAETTGTQRQLGVMVAWRANEYSQDSDYLNVFQWNEDRLPTSVGCPSQHICHLVYVQP